MYSTIDNKTHEHVEKSSSITGNGNWNAFVDVAGLKREANRVGGLVRGTSRCVLVLRLHKFSEHSAREWRNVEVEIELRCSSGDETAVVEAERTEEIQ